jgi:hypothetical protein
MWALFYSFTIGFVAAVLFLIVDQFEPDRRYANVLKLLILAVVAAAIVRRLRIAAPAWPPRSCGNLVSIPDLYPMALAKGMARSKSHKICEAPLRGRRSVNFGPPPRRGWPSNAKRRGADGSNKQTSNKHGRSKQTSVRCRYLLGAAEHDLIRYASQTRRSQSPRLL